MYLTSELLSVDRLSTGSVTASEVAALNHELGNDTMKFTALQKGDKVTNIHAANGLFGRWVAASVYPLFHHASAQKLKVVIGKAVPTFFILRAIL